MLNRKFAAYLQSARIQRGPNLRGLSLIPKSLWPAAPYNRALFNEFVAWVHRLQLPEAKWVVDVGANHGDFSQAAGVLFPAAQVLLVEPLPTLHAELQRRGAERSRRWRLATCALSRERGTATLHVDRARDDIGSLAVFSGEYLQANPDSQTSRTFACEVRTLDDLCLEHGIRKIDLLKIDVEGFEFEVLAGGGKMLPATEALIVEVSLVRRAGDADALERMLRLLRSAGFQLVELLPSYFAADRPWLPLEFNLLARRK